jgi:hypothetical protein
VPVPGRRFIVTRLLPVTFLVALAVILLLPVFADAQTRKVAVGGADAGTCLSAPCGSVAYAYRQATPGDVVELAGGTYGGQSVPALGRATPIIEIRPASGAAVTLNGSLDVNADNVVVRDMKASDLNVDNGNDVVENVTTVGIDAVSAYFQNTKNLIVRGGHLGGLMNKTPVYVGSTPVSYNVTFDGVDFHDALVNDSAAHTECLMVNDVQGMVIKNSIFRNCGYFGVMISHLFADVGPRDVTLENNVFEHTVQWNGQRAPFSMLVGPVNAINFVFRNNTFETPPTFNQTTFTGTSRMVGNLGAMTGSCSKMAYSRNVWTATTCGATDKRNASAVSQFVNPAGHDFHLKAGAAAIDAGDKADYPGSDRDGYGRPVGAAPDAGAYEYGAKPSTPSGGGATPGGGGGSAGGGAGGGTGATTGGATTVAGDAVNGVRDLLPVSDDGATSLASISGVSPTGALRSAKIGSTTICVVVKAGCNKATRLTLTTARRARVVVSMRWIRSGKKAKLVRRVRRNVKTGKVSVRLTSKHLRAGTYRVTVAVIDAKGAIARASIALRVK